MGYMTLQVPYKIKPGLGTPACTPSLPVWLCWKRTLGTQTQERKSSVVLGTAGCDTWRRQTSLTSTLQQSFCKQKHASLAPLICKSFSLAFQHLQWKRKSPRLQGRDLLSKMYTVKLWLRLLPAQQHKIYRAILRAGNFLQTAYLGELQSYQQGSEI